MATWTCRLEDPNSVSFEVITSDSSVAATETVSYSCNFQNNWSGENHPRNYPSFAHWSPPVMTTHSDGYTMWREGGMATEGVEIVAENGWTGALLDEISGSASTGMVVVGEVTFNDNTQSQTFDSIRMTPTHPYLSAITMIVPSPDWFTGFHDFNAINADTQTWYSQFSMTTYPYDAGTEEGDDYSGDNSATDPQEPVMRFDVNTVPNTGVFLNDSEDDVLPVAMWTCTIVEEPEPIDIGNIGGICFSGSSLVEVKGKGIISIDQLNVGDEVRVGPDSFDHVFGFGHKTHSGKFSYLEIKTTENSNSLKISKSHMLFVVDIGSGEIHAVPASDVKVGNWLHTDSTIPAQVEDIISVFDEGAYAPFTKSGTIVVNGVVSSNYVSLQGTDTLTVGSVKTSLNMHFLAHFFTSPFRVLTMIGVQMSESYNANGVSTWIDLPHKLAKDLLTQNGIIIGVVVFLGMIAILPIYAAELVMSLYLSQIILMFAAFVLLSGVYKRSSIKKNSV